MALKQLALDDANFVVRMVCAEVEKGANKE